MINVGELLRLLGIRAKRRMDEWWAPCPSPSHSETEPSWHVVDRPGSERHGSHHCFGCDFGGGPLDLVREIFDFGGLGAARRWLDENGFGQTKHLASGAQLAVLPTVTSSVFRMPFGVVTTTPLAKWPTPARRYAESRGIDGGQVERWGIGYSASGRLSGRLVFPFHSVDGSLGGYSARAFIRSAHRYLTPDAAEGPDLSALFGSLRWPPRRRRLVVTEGAINALACERAGAPAIAAINGSHLGPGQVLQLASFEELLAAADPDKAGEKLWQALRSLARWINVRRVKIPEGEDAASMPIARLAEVIR